MNRRRLLIGGGAAFVTALTAGAAYTAGQARTPAQRAARAEPPEASVITAPVRRGHLWDGVVLNGTVVRAQPVEVRGPVEAETAALLVVTGLAVQVGDEVRAGDVLAEVSGRPVIALPGEFPQYRELRRGMTGPDVRQLQAGLQPLYGTPVDGVFTERTEADLRQLYERVGNPPVLRAAPPPDDSAGSPEDGAPEDGSPTQLALPVGEIAFIASPPAYVSEVVVQVGQEVTGPLMTLMAGAWQVVAPLEGQLEQELRGDPELEFGAGPMAGEPAELREIREVASDQDGAPPQREAVFEAPATDELEPMTGQEVVVLRSSSDPEALIVPVAALHTAPDGTVTLRVIEGQSERAVPVTVGVSVRGEAAVEPQASDDLVAGDEVLLSR